MTAAAFNISRSLAHRILAQEPDRYFMPNQYANPNNVLAHYETTGPEIFRHTGGDIACFVAGMGTGGTLMGVGKYLREKDPRIRIVGIEPRLGRPQGPGAEEHEGGDRAGDLPSLGPRREDHRRGRARLRRRPGAGAAGRAVRRHVERRRRGRRAGSGPQPFRRHHRHPPSRPGGPLPQHHPLPVGLRLLPAVMPGCK